jgi:hypothetical protein
LELDRFSFSGCRVEGGGGFLMRFFAAIIVVVVGVLVLAGYFFPPLAGVQSMLLTWAVILAGAAAVMGVFNLISVHGEKIQRREKGGIYSLLLLLAFLASLGLSLMNTILAFLQAPTYPVQELLVNGILAPSEGALLAILTVTLLYAAMRLLRRRIDLMSVIFLATVVLVLLGSATLPFGEIPILGDIFHPWLTQVLALGGARGILIGVALGTLTTGLRVLFAIDRPYGGK